MYRKLLCLCCLNSGGRSFVRHPAFILAPYAANPLNKEKSNYLYLLNFPEIMGCAYILSDHSVRKFHVSAIQQPPPRCPKPQFGGLPLY